MTAEERTAAALLLFSTPTGPMPRRMREALLIVASNVSREPEQIARIQREIARMATS